MIELSRRSLFSGLGALIAAPAVVKAASLMPVRGIVMPVRCDYLFWRANMLLREIEAQYEGHEIIRQPVRILGAGRDVFVPYGGVATFAPTDKGWGVIGIAGF